MSVVYFVILLGIIVFIHELGHFIAAKIFNVYVGEFALGMGPKLLSKKGKETTYSLRLLPLGGFCQMAGETENTLEGENEANDLDLPKERTIKGISKWKQIVILVAGAMMNFVLAWFIFSMVFFSQGISSSIDIPQIGSIQENSPAELAGFEIGDNIISVEFEDGSIIYPETFTEMSKTSSEYPESTRVYTIERNGTELQIEVTPAYNEDYDAYMIGIGVPTETIKLSLFEGFKYGSKQTVYVLQMMWESILELFQGKNLDQLSGPIGIFTVTSEQAALGLSNYIWLIAVISLNVGLFNLLPLPILDGGRIIFVLYEAVMRKPVNKRFENGLMTFALLVLFGLMIFVAIQDITRLIK